MNMVFESFAAKLKHLREAKDLTKYRLAKLSGIAEAYIGQLESGRVDQPRRTTLKALAKGLGESPSIFFESEQLERTEPDIKDFLLNELPKLDEEGKDWVRRTINMVRERKAEREKYKAEKEGND